MKMLELERTQAGVRSLLYFVENFLEQKTVLLPYQRNFIMELEEETKAEIKTVIETAANKVFYIDPLKIKVKDGLERFRRDLGDLKELGKSLKETGQIQPAVINRKNELIVGGRRTAACILEGLKVKVIYEDMVDPVKMRLYELEENLHRKDLTPAEYALATEELHKLMQQEKGESVSGRAGGHTLDDTAKILGKSRGSVISELERAEMVKAFPVLKNAKKKSEFTKTAKGLQKLQVAMASLKNYEETVTDKTNLFELHNTDAVKYMRSLPGGCKDILLTDPPYGIDYDKNLIGIGGKTGGSSTTGFKINDEAEEALFLYKELAIESFRFTTPQAHGYVFCGPEHFWTLRQIFISAGWRVHIKPLIWVKPGSGQCNVPSIWPASCYEMLLYIRKDASKLVKEGQPDWIECSIVSQSNRIHYNEKPVSLLLNLLERVSLPGQYLVDPFMGSGSSIEAGLKLRLLCEGCDSSLEAYAVASKRLKEMQEGE